MSKNHDFDIAISYASENIDVADVIAVRLRRDGFRCFYAPNRLHKLLGTPLPRSLEEVFGDPSVVVVALVSTEYLRKDWTRKEYEAAVARNPNKMIVVRYPGQCLPDAISDHSYADLERFGPEGVALQISAAIGEQFGIQSRFSPMAQTRIKSEIKDIEAIDYPDQPYSLDDVTFLDTERENLIDVYSNDFEFEKLEDYISLGNNTFGHTFKPIGVTEDDILESKAETRRLVDIKQASGWSVFNGKKFGVTQIQRSRTAESEDHLLSVIVYTTDYYSSQFAKRLYRRLRADARIKPFLSGSLSPYAGLLRSFGFDLVLFAGQEGTPHIVLTRRSANVANADETKGYWHVSMNEGLSASDRYNQEFSAAPTVYRGFFEELGLNRADLVRVELFEPFIELRNFEPAIIGAAYTPLSAAEVISRAKEASDTLLEHDGFMAIPATADAVTAFLESGAPKTNVLEFCLRSVLQRELLI